MLIYLRKIAIFIALTFTFSFICYGIDEPEISADSAVLIDADTFDVLFEKKSDVTRSMASTTKIMTTLIAVESGKLADVVTIKDKTYIEGTAIGFAKGDKITLKDLCYAMMLESGNDAAVITAVYLAGSEEKFSKVMNKKAYEIGMHNTNFVTASGLDDENHYTTAYDMALLGAYAIKNSTFREISSSVNYKCEFADSDKIRYFSNHNRLLKECEGVIGGKTGFTRKSGRCLVSICERNGKTLVCVTLNAPDDWNDHKKLFSYGFSLYSETELKADVPGVINVYGADNNILKIKANEDINTVILSGSDIDVKVFMKSFVYAPVVKNEAIGEIIVYQNGCAVKKVDIVSVEKIECTDKFKVYSTSPLFRALNYIKNIFKDGK